MPLSRAQLIAGDNNTGIPTLAGQVQGVTAGSGITISSAGVLSVDASTITGVVKTNSLGAFNSYVWPVSDGLPNTYLKTNGSGLLSWEPVSGFSVVVVQSGAPTSPDIGELWFDCATGTLNVYQDCVGSPTPNWFNVAQPGFPVLPVNTSASPNFTPGGAGTQANPYVCTVTTTGPGTTVYVVNTVTITGLASYQYVPIVDLNAVLNGGRFTFSNYYANAAGTLVFQTIFSDLPASPPAASYTAAIRVGYSSVYIDAVVDIVSSFSITSPGSISGTPIVGQTLTYTQGTYTGGVPPVAESWIWKDSSGTTLASNTPTYIVTAAEVGKTIYVEYKVIDSSLPPITLTRNTSSTQQAHQPLAIATTGAITGNAIAGQTLTYTPATISGGLAPVNTSWAWKDSGGNVLATNTNTFIIPPSLVGDTIYVEFTATDSAVPQASVTDATPPTATIVASVTITSPGSISGSPIVGQTLTYTQGTYTGGVPPVAESWIWKDSGGATLASNTPTYVVTATEVGKTIYVEYKVVDSSLPPITLTANTSPTQQAHQPLAIVTAGAITGNAVNGQTLTYTPATISGGLAPVNTSWAWKDSGGNVLATNTNTFTIPSSLIGNTIYVEFTATDSAIPTATVTDTSPPTATIAASIIITSPGSISGSPRVGQILTYTKGTYSGGTPPVTESWIWKDSGGATLASNTLTYTVTAAEAGKSIFVEYKVIDSSAPSVTLTANTTSTAPVFKITSPGSVSGVPAVGQTLTYTTGTYVGGLAPVSTTWRWKDSGGATLATNTPTYVVTTAEANKSIYVEYTVIDSSTPTQFLAALTPSTSPVLAITSAGSISGTANVGQVLTYTQGTYSGGLAPVVETWKWKDSSGNILASNVPTYTITASEAGETIYVEYTATDSSTPATALSANTASTATVTFVPFPGGVWSPTPPTGLNVSPGLISGPYSGTSSTITPTGCIEVSTDGTTFVKAPATLPIVGGTDTLYARWVTTPAGSCGDSPTVTNISGSVSDGTYINPYNLAVSRIPSPAIGNLTDGPVPLIATVTKATSTTIQGLTATAYVTYVGTSTGSAISASTDNVTFTPLATSGQGFSVVNGQTLYIRQTVGSTVSTGYTAIIRVGDGTNTASTYGEFTYTATTTSDATIPNLLISPTAGPNASPSTVLVPAETLDGQASGTWPASPSPLTVTSTSALLFSLNGGAPGQGPQTFNTGDTIDLTWDTAIVNAAANGATISGDLVSSPYTNPYSFVVDRTPDAFTLADLAGEPVSSQVDSETVNIIGINVPTFLTYTAGTPNSLLNPFVSINNGPQVAIPSSGNTLLVPPGATLEFFADTGPTAPVDYTITFNLGALSVPWKASTLAGPGVVQPSITTPTNNATGINPTAAGTPYGVTLTGSAYATTGGAGAHTSSNWDLYAAIPYQPETTGTINNVQVTGPGTTNPMANWAGTVINGTPSNYQMLGVAGKPNGTYVAIADYTGATFVSFNNGVEWVQTSGPFVPTAASSTSAAANAPISIAEGNGVFVAGSDGGCLSRSIDGVNWTQQVIAGAGTGDFTWVSYGGGQFVTWDSSTGCSRTSPDGITWTQRNVIAANMLDGAYGLDGSSNPLWVSVGGTGSTPRLYTSSDGQTWTAQTSGVAKILRTVVYGNGLWVVGGEDNTLLTSTNGVTWTPQTSPMTATSEIYSSAFGDGIYVIGNSTGQMAYSTNGTTWTLIAAGTGAGQTGFSAQAVNKITYQGGIFMAAGGALTSGKISTTTASYLTLTFTNNTGFSNFSVGDYVKEVGGGADGLGVISAIRSGSNEIDLKTYSGTWDNGSTLKGNSSRSLLMPTAPTTTPPDVTKYTQIVNVTGDTSNLTSYFVSIANLALGTTYYARVAYTSSDPITSSFSAWSKFTTANSFNAASTSGKLYQVSPATGALTTFTYIPLANSTSTVAYAITNPGNGSGLGGSTVENATFGGDTVLYKAAAGILRPVLVDTTQVSNPYNVYGIPCVTTTGDVSMNRNLGNKAPLSAGEFALLTESICKQSNITYLVTTNGRLFLTPTSTSALAGSGAGSGWRQITYTLPAGEKIVQVAGLGSNTGLYLYGTKAVILSDAGKLYAVGTNGTDTDFGIPDTGTWAAPVQITGISGVTSIAAIGLGEGLSAVTSSGDVWFGAQSVANRGGGDLTFQLVGTGALSPIWGIDTTPTRYYIIKSDGLYYQKTTTFVGGGVDVFSLATYGAVAQNPVLNVGNIATASNGVSSAIVIP
jgi:hypothetical protein